MNTPQTSRELVRDIFEKYQFKNAETGYWETDEVGAAALIDAWVRVREAEMAHFIANHCDEEGYIHRSEILAIATARKQLVKK